MLFQRIRLIAVLYGGLCYRNHPLRKHNLSETFRPVQGVIERFAYHQYRVPVSVQTEEVVISQAVLPATMEVSMREAVTGDVREIRDVHITSIEGFG